MDRNQGEAVSQNNPVIFYAGEINRDGYYALTNLCGTIGFHKNATVVLATYGGDPHAGYRIGRCLQHHFEKFRIVIPDHCKSAGTLVAMAANEIVMCDRAELGPLDVQVLKNHELFERGSGLDLPQSINALKTQVLGVFRDSLIDMRMGGRLSTKIAGEMATSLTTGLFAPIFAQIDPLRLGELQRANTIGHEYGERLSKRPMNMHHNAIAKLIVSYPSHSFVIDRKEAKTLFKCVGMPNDRDSNFIKNLYPHMDAMLNSEQPIVQDLTDAYYGEHNEPGANGQNENDVSNSPRPRKSGKGGGQKVDGNGEEPGKGSSRKPASNGSGAADQPVN